MTPKRHTTLPTARSSSVPEFPVSALVRRLRLPPMKQLNMGSFDPRTRLDIVYGYKVQSDGCWAGIFDVLDAHTFQNATTSELLPVCETRKVNMEDDVLKLHVKGRAMTFLLSQGETWWPPSPFQRLILMMRNGMQTACRETLMISSYIRRCASHRRRQVILRESPRDPKDIKVLSTLNFLMIPFLMISQIWT